MTTRRLLALGLLFLMAGGLNGCAFFREDRIHYTLNAETSSPCEDCIPAAPPGRFVGLALSGGGSRSAVFSAAAIEVLAEQGLMQQVDYISSVSGGGFPAVYYALNRPEPCEASEASCNDFSLFQDAMRHNYFNDMEKRQFLNANRFSSPTRRINSLEDALNGQFMAEAMFADLPKSPTLLINAARYDDGRRFVFSNIAIPEEAGRVPPYTNETLRAASFSLPECPRPTPPEFSVALAAAISASFPPLLGPASLKMPVACGSSEYQYWHLGDGGILENTGVETLEEIALRGHQSDALPEKVIIFSVDAGRMTTEESMKQSRTLNMWTSDPGRVVDIANLRADAYRDIVTDLTRDQIATDFVVIHMRYTDAKVDRWPDSCGRTSGGTAEIAEYIAKIPTHLKITECDADLMVRAARDIVTRRLQEHRDELSALGLLRGDDVLN